MNWGGEFQGGKNDMVTFQFQKPPGEFDGRIRYLNFLSDQLFDFSVEYKLINIKPSRLVQVAQLLENQIFAGRVCNALLDNMSSATF